MKELSITRFFRKLRHAEKKILIGYMRYAQQHRDSNRLPLILFILLFFDAFVLVIPSLVLCAAAVTITPRRWTLFASIFVLAVICNNSVTYGMGRILPASQIHLAVEWMNIELLFETAKDAIRQYGKYATLIGGFLPLPTQLVTLLIGMADAQALSSSKELGTSILPALAFAALGHGLKIFGFCFLIRFGWVRLEKKLERQQNLS